MSRRKKRQKRNRDRRERQAQLAAENYQISRKAQKKAQKKARKMARLNGHGILLVRHITIREIKENDY